jgi:hypothetical protein
VLTSLDLNYDRLCSTAGKKATGNRENSRLFKNKEFWRFIVEKQGVCIEILQLGQMRQVAPSSFSKFVKISCFGMYSYIYNYGF